MLPLHTRRVLKGALSPTILPPQCSLLCFIFPSEPPTECPYRSTKIESSIELGSRFLIKGLFGLKFKGKVRDLQSSDSDTVYQIPDFLGGRDELAEVKVPLCSDGSSNDTWQVVVR